MQYDDLILDLARRTACEESQMYFTRTFFKQRERAPFTMNWHHLCVARALDMVISGEISRLWITLAPGYTKTMFLLDFMARGFALDEMSKFIHITYSSKLANNNSRILRDTIEMAEYQRYWSVRMSKDSNAKGQWNTRHGGGLVASGVTGTITGFRAGRITPNFSGAMTLDDLIKPQEANSKRVRDKTNGSLNDTIRSRLMTPSTPIVGAMQRVHDEDPVGFCLRGGTGDYWYHLNLPVLMTKENMNPGKKYAQKYPYAIPLLFEDLFKEGWTWPLRVDKKEFKRIKKGSPIVAAAQYLQEPTVLEGAFIKGKWLRYYDELPHYAHFKRVVMIADTAFEKGQQNDRSVYFVVGHHKNGYAYILDYLGMRLEVDDVQQFFKKKWDYWRQSEVTGLPRVSAFYVEKKASGHSIIQWLRKHGVAVQPVERNRDKVSRVIEAIPALKTGAVLLPAKKFKGDFTNNKQWSIMHEEILKFTVDMTHANDDYVDVLCDTCDIFYNSPAGFRQAFGTKKSK